MEEKRISSPLFCAIPCTASSRFLSQQVPCTLILSFWRCDFCRKPGVRHPRCWPLKREMGKLYAWVQLHRVSRTADSIGRRILRMRANSHLLHTDEWIVRLYLLCEWCRTGMFRWVPSMASSKAQFRNCNHSLLSKMFHPLSGISVYSILQSQKCRFYPHCNMRRAVLYRCICQNR